MRRIFPDSLPAWSLIILIVGLVVTQVSTLIVVAHGRENTARMLEFFRLAQRVSSVTRALATADPDSRADLARALSDSTLSVAVGPVRLATASIPDNEEMAELQDILEARLADVGISDVHVERRNELTRETPEAASPPTSDPGPIETVLSDLELEVDKTGAYVASIALSDGQWLNFTVWLAPRGLLWTPTTIAFAALIILVVLAACLFIVRYLSAPFRMLGEAAERIGNDLNAPGLPERGPRELRAAAHALNAMQNRLQRVVADRDQLVAAIAHDLRTPITRLKLRADMIADGAQRERLIADVDEIAGMTQSILAFASNAARPEKRETLDLISMLETLSSDLPAATLTLPPDCPPRIAYFGEPIGLRRCVGNLIENAIKYGGVARITLSIDAKSVVIRVEDDGPGIPEAELDAVFAPFRRLETSRSRETGGTGLGLTIARTIARAHGGDIRLTNLPKGLRAELILPVAAARSAPRAA